MSGARRYTGRRVEASPLYGNVDLIVAEKGTIDQRSVVKFKITASMTL